MLYPALITLAAWLVGLLIDANNPFEHPGVGELRVPLPALAK